MGKFQSTKLLTDLAQCFVNGKATDTHCKFLHGYAIEFKVTFEGELDYRNWVWDFGGMKRSKTKIDGMSAKEWMDYMFDHTTVIAKDDPYLEIFSKMHEKGIIQLRVLDGPVGAEKFSEYIFNN